MRFSELISSILDNGNRKIRNPFFGTLTFVWVAKHWQLVYMIIFFDDWFNVWDRIDLIKEYWTGVGFYTDLGICSFITLCVLFISYFFIATSYALTNWYDAIGKPQILNLIKAKQKYVLKSDYEKMQKQSDNYFGKYQEAIEFRNKFENEYDGLVESNRQMEDRIATFKIDKQKEIQSIIEKYQLDITDLNSKLLNSQNQLTQVTTNYEFEIVPLKRYKNATQNFETQINFIKVKYDSMKGLQKDIFLEQVKGVINEKENSLFPVGSMDSVLFKVLSSGTGFLEFGINSTTYKLTWLGKLTLQSFYELYIKVDHG